MLQTTKRTIATLTAAACLGSAGWAIAGTSSGSSSTAGQASRSTATDTAIAASSTAATTTPTAPQGRPAQQSVTGAAAEKIRAAVLAKVPGATIDRVEQDPQRYHVHITRSDGTRATARVNAQFEVTSVEAGGGPGGRGAGGPGGQRSDETPLTGDNAAKAKAAALAKLPGSTVVRLETDADGAGVYEAHVTKSDGSPATVIFDKDFNVTAVNEH